MSEELPRVGPSEWSWDETPPHECEWTEWTPTSDVGRLRRTCTVGKCVQLQNSPNAELFGH